MLGSDLLPRALSSVAHLRTLKPGTAAAVWGSSTGSMVYSNLQALVLSLGVVLM